LPSTIEAFVLLQFFMQIVSAIYNQVIAFSPLLYMTHVLHFPILYIYIYIHYKLSHPKTKISETEEIFSTNTRTLRSAPAGGGLVVGLARERRRAAACVSSHATRARRAEERVNGDARTPFWALAYTTPRERR